MPEHLTNKEFHSLSRVYVLLCIKNVKALLHGTQRKAMRMLISPEVRRRDTLRERRKLGELIQALDAKPLGDLTLHSLPDPITGQITDPPAIQKILNQHFFD